MEISVGGTINRTPATLEFVDEERADYALAAPRDFIILRFPPNQQNITLPIFLFGDTLPEGTEAFQAISTASPDSPNFDPPSMGGAFASTDVLIIDDDCKLGCIICSIRLLCWYLFCVVVVVGFVQPKYTVGEGVFFPGVCIRIFNPSQDEDLVFAVDLIIQPRIGTAGKFISKKISLTVLAVYLTFQMDQTFLIGQFLLLVSQLPLPLEHPDVLCFCQDF